MRVINGILLALLLIVVITVIIILIIAAIVGKQIKTIEPNGRTSNFILSSKLKNGTIFIRQSGRMELPKSTGNQFVTVITEGPVELIIPFSGTKREITISRKVGSVHVMGGKGVMIRGSSLIDSETGIFRSSGSDNTRPGIYPKEFFVRIQ